MKFRNNDHIESLVELALSGEAIPADSLTASQAARVAQLRTLHASLQSELFEAPAALISQAIGIYQLKPAPSRVASLLQSTFQLAGARLDGGSTFLARYDLAGSELRLQYQFDGAQWEVLGQISGDWELEVNDAPLAMDEQGRFQFVADSAEKTGMAFASDLGSFEIPPVSEAVSGERSDPAS